MNERTPSVLRVTLYEPRWHGFAKWTAELQWPVPGGALLQEIHSGFIRRRSHGVRSRKYPDVYVSRGVSRGIARRLA